MKLLSTEEDKIVTDGMLKFESVVQPYPPVVLLFDRKQDEDEDDDDDDEEGDTTTNKEEEERSEEEEEEPQQYIRTIKPYPYTYRTYAKRRWLGRTILDIYSTDYASYPISYYVSGTGRVQYTTVQYGDHNTSRVYLCTIELHVVVFLTKDFISFSFLSFRSVHFQFQNLDT